MTAHDPHDLAILTTTPLPPPAGGDTARRWLTMADWARTRSVSTARLAEGHHDALAILHEADLEPRPGVYGVWASQSPADVAIDMQRLGLSGCKRFCSGLGIVSRALIIAADLDGRQLLVETTTDPGERVTHDLAGWHTPALAATATGSICFEQHTVDRVVGEPDSYLGRPGFWHGAIGPSACWAGAALGLIDTARAIRGTTSVDDIALGELAAEQHLLTRLLRSAGDSADAHPHDIDIAQRCAYSVRYLIERSATRIADTFGRTFGPRPFVASPQTAQRFSDLHLYLRQHHGLRDLAELGAMGPP